MTPEHAKALLPFITAYSEGKTIQHNSNARIGTTPEWTDLINPRFLSDPNDLRIKPTLHPDVSFSPDGYLLPPRVGEWASKHTLTEAAIPESHRPYVKGEVLREGDLYQYKDGSVERVYGLAGIPTETLLGIGFTTAPLPEPKLVPMTSDDLPPFLWVRNKAKQRLRHVLLITTWDMETGSFWYKVDNGSVQIKPERFHEWEYSPDRKTWHSLMKEVQA